MLAMMQTFRSGEAVVSKVYRCIYFAVLVLFLFFLASCGSDSSNPVESKTDHSAEDQSVLVLNADLDSDGNNDLTTSNETSNNVSVLLNLSISPPE